MVKTKGARSKRMPSAQRHKIERKKREHKRDLRKAAKALAKNGMAPKRSKKARQAAKMVLKISNADPDKERYLSQMLEAREAARVVRAQTRREKRAEAAASEAASNVDGEAVQRAAVEKSERQAMYVPVKYHFNQKYQFMKIVEDLVFPAEKGAQGLPCSLFLVTADIRCAVQSLPWTLLDSIIAASKAKEDAKPHKVLILIAMTKCDIVSASAIGTQVALLDHALAGRYPDAAESGVVFSACPVSIYFDNSIRHLLKMVRAYNTEVHAGVDKAAASKATNLTGKVACFLFGLPGTGRHSLSKAMATVGTDSAVIVTSLRSGRVQAGKEEADPVKFVIPNSRLITVVTIPEDNELTKQSGANVISGDILFQNASYLERMQEPEHVAAVLLGGCVDRTLLAQAFCQPAFAADDATEAMKFLIGIGRSVTRDRGFNVSPLLIDGAGTAGRIASSSLLASHGFTTSKTSLLDTTYSQAAPTKFVHLSSVVYKGKKGGQSLAVKRTDGQNPARIGARTFLREFVQGRNVPWAVMRPGSNDDAITAESAATLRVISLKHFVASTKVKVAEGPAPFAAFAEALSELVNPNLVLLPRAVVEFSADAICPILHDTEGSFEPESESDDEVDALDDFGSDEEDFDEEFEEMDEEMDADDDDDSADEE